MTWSMTGGGDGRRRRERLRTLSLTRGVRTAAGVVPGRTTARGTADARRRLAVVGIPAVPRCE